MIGPATGTRRPGCGSCAHEAELAHRLGKDMECCYLVPDKGRQPDFGDEGELGHMLRAKQLAVRTVEGGADRIRLYYPYEGGGSPVIVDVEAARAVLERPVVGGAAHPEGGPPQQGDEANTSGGETFADASSDDEQAIAAAAALRADKAGRGGAGLCAGHQLVGASYSDASANAPRRRYAAISKRTGRLRGYLRFRCHGTVEPQFELASQRSNLTEADFTGLFLIATEAGPWFLCRWPTPSRDAATSWVRRLLPEACLIVKLGGRDAAPKRDAPGGSSDTARLVAALKEGTCCVCKGASRPGS